MNTTERERVLARALRAALRWPYLDFDIHVKTDCDLGDPFDQSYIADVHEARAGLRVADEIERR